MTITWLNSIIIFNPTLVSPKEESNDELYKQVLTFIHRDNTDKLTELEQLKLVGLIRGIHELSNNFNNGDNSQPVIVNGSGSSHILIELETNYFLICDIDKKDDDSVVNRQLINLIRTSYRNFTLFNKSITAITKKYGDLNFLKNVLSQHWQGFLNQYNLQIVKTLTKSGQNNWFNLLNNRGFLGVYDSASCYKKSSISLSHQIKEDISSYISDHPQVKGIIINYFNKKVLKKHGLVYYSSDDSINSNSLVDIYNWLEFNEYHNNFENFKLEMNGNDMISSLVDQDEQVVVDEGYGFDISTGLRILNPVNLTNNLLINPLNYTVSTVIETTQNATTNVTPDWLSMPKFFQKLTTRDGEDNTVVREENTEETEDVDEESGEYLIGLQSDGRISRKVVYLNSKDDDLNYKEHQLVVFRKDDIYITLIYESSEPQLDDPSFYHSLQSDFLNPVIVDQFENILLGGSSIASLKLSSIYTDAIDQEFFHIIYDPTANNFQSSLPYLPYIPNDTNTILKYQAMAIYYLHDQLSLIFKPDFYRNQLHEFFHKFTSNKLNDWMFYYFKYNEKCIIVIKNRSKHATNTSTTPAIEKSMVDKITRRFSEYTNLSFLENLGDDVKYWLGTQQQQEEEQSEVSS
ncbi:hypothetical protein SBY92_003776 [Candida maltosa Xu316]|uniref:Putative homotypic vacuole fusion complex subunit Ccz1p n=1 Tax=Candida maltosa (strain Xu316) TaxID=1245528 RepID=M3K5L6_CANMX|nr:putative homotypic vacuole fusion complex subunit Ccz1p [Candida maltosa Xu316]